MPVSLPDDLFAPDSELTELASSLQRRSRPDGGGAGTLGIAGQGWLDPAMVALSLQRSDGEWRFSPWLIAGREDLYPKR